MKLLYVLLAGILCLSFSEVWATSMRGWSFAQFRQTMTCQGRCGQETGACKCSRDCVTDGTLKSECCPDFKEKCACFQGTCQGSCLKTPDPTANRFCNCEEKCQLKADLTCCSDYESQCGCVINSTAVSLYSCKGRCGASSQPCICTPECRKSNFLALGCCPDFAAQCPCLKGTCNGWCTKDILESADRNCKCTPDCFTSDDGTCCSDYKSLCSGCLNPPEPEFRSCPDSFTSYFGKCLKHVSTAVKANEVFQGCASLSPPSSPFNSQTTPGFFPDISPFKDLTQEYWVDDGPDHLTLVKFDSDDGEYVKNRNSRNMQATSHPYLCEYNQEYTCCPEKS